MSDPATRRMTALDRPWAPAVTATVLGPMEVPAPGALAESLHRIATEHPESRLGWSIDDTGHRWSRLPVARPGLVAELNADPANDYGSFLTGLAGDDAGAWPLRFLVGHDHVAVRMSHAVGDGRSLVMLLSAALGSAAFGQQTGFRHPLLRAGWNFFGRSPRRILAAARAARLSSPDPEPAGTPWSPERMTLYQEIPADLTAELRRWRKRHSSGTSNAAVLLSLLLRALRAGGTSVEPQVRVLFDARRYLPGAHAELFGNFSVGLLMELSAADPVDRIATVISTATAAGRPLTAMGVGLAAGRRPSCGTRLAPLDPPAAVAFTYLGRPLSIERLPWHDSVRVWAGSVEPSGPQGLTFAATETGRSVHLSASFHANVLDPVRIRAALALLATDPVTVLTGGSAVPKEIAL